MKKGTGRKTALIILILYILLVLRITVFRAGFSFYGLFRHGRFNTEIFTDLIRILRGGSIMTFCYLFFGNIGWFVPYGVLLPASGITDPDTCRHAALKTVFSGMLFSVMIEFGQYMFGTGVTEIDDVILNTAGVALGYLLFRAVRRLAEKRRQKNG